MFLLGQLSISGLNWQSSAFDAKPADAVYEKNWELNSGQMSPWTLLRKSCQQFAACTQMLKCETLGTSYERGGVCEDPVSLRQIVTSGAIILLVSFELALEGVLKVRHVSCLIFCWNTVLSWILSRKPDRGKKVLIFLSWEIGVALSNQRDIWTDTCPATILFASQFCLHHCFTLYLIIPKLAQICLRIHFFKSRWSLRATSMSLPTLSKQNFSHRMEPTWSRWRRFCDFFLDFLPMTCPSEM